MKCTEAKMGKININRKNSDFLECLIQILGLDTTIKTANSEKEYFLRHFFVFFALHFHFLWAVNKTKLPSPLKRENIHIYAGYA
jgi:hypothetical protein